jgi:hypothetical protein
MPPVSSGLLAPNGTRYVAKAPLNHPNKLPVYELAHDQPMKKGIVCGRHATP